MIFPFFFFSFLVWFIRIEGEFRLHGITGRHRMREQLRLEGTFGDHLVQVPCSRQGQPEQVLRAAAKLGFEYFQRRRVHNLLKHALPVFDHLHVYYV